MASLFKARLNKFAMFVRLHQFPLVCSGCNFRSKPYEMQEHLLSHCSSSKNVCPWCLGDYSWPPNKKMYHVEHLETCYKTFVKEYLTLDARFQCRLKAFKDSQETFWTQTVEECEVPFKCPRCDESFLPKYLERHYADSHKVKVKKCCVFCDGKYHGKDAHHLKSCFKKRREALFEVVKFAFDLRPTCPERHLFGREKRFPPEYYEDMFVRYLYDDDDDGIDFRGNVQLAKVYVTHFVTRPDWKWYLVMVRDVAMESFRNVMEENRDTTFLLPFWCWYDGGHNHNRHMILVTSDPTFMVKKWRNVAGQHRRRCRRQRCKTSKPIGSWWHLVNTIHYLSNRRSRCNFLACTDTTSKECHYCIGKSLPRTFKMCMATLYPDGFQQLLTERFGRWTVKQWVKYAIRDDKWRVPVRCVWEEDQDEVLPVSFKWIPNPRGRKGDPGLCLLNGHTLYFTKNPSEPGTEVKWLEDQWKGGNVFPRVLMDGFWTPPPSMQREANATDELLLENVAMREQIIRQNGKMYELRCEKEAVQGRMEELQRDKMVMQCRLDCQEERIKQLECEKKQLECEKEQLECEKEQLECEKEH